jgi:hypothetical protein
MSKEENKVAFRQETEFATHPTDFNEVLESMDESCPGFHKCVDREFEGGKVDCDECKEDALSAMRAEEAGG